MTRRHTYEAVLQACGPFPRSRHTGYPAIPVTFAAFTSLQALSRPKPCWWLWLKPASLVIQSAWRSSYWDNRGPRESQALPVQTPALHASFPTHPGQLSQLILPVRLPGMDSPRKARTKVQSPMMSPPWWLVPREGCWEALAWGCLELSVSKGHQQGKDWPLCGILALYTCSAEKDQALCMWDLDRLSPPFPHMDSGVYRCCPTWVAVKTMMCWTSRHVRQGRTCSIKAIMPAAKGAAAEVPVWPSVQPVPF